MKDKCEKYVMLINDIEKTKNKINKDKYKALKKLKKEIDIEVANGKKLNDELVEKISKKMFNENKENIKKIRKEIHNLRKENDYYYKYFNSYEDDINALISNM